MSMLSSPKGGSSIQPAHGGDLKIILPWGFWERETGFFFHLISKNKGNKLKETKRVFWCDTLFALSLQNKLGKIAFHSCINCLLQRLITAVCCLFWWHPCLWQQHLWRAAIHQTYKRRWKIAKLHRLSSVKLKMGS